MNYSKEHVRYLKRLRGKKAGIAAGRVAVVIAFFGLWEALTALGALDSFITSSPSRMALKLVELFQTGDLLYHMGITLAETVLSFVLGASQNSSRPGDYNMGGSGNRRNNRNGAAHLADNHYNKHVAGIFERRRRQTAPIQDDEGKQIPDAYKTGTARVHSQCDSRVKGQRGTVLGRHNHGRIPGFQGGAGIPDNLRRYDIRP